jgi:hypothetical protein
MPGRLLDATEVASLPPTEHDDTVGQRGSGYARLRRVIRHRTRLRQATFRGRAGGEQLPMALGDDIDGAVDHLDGGLIVDRVRGH